MSLNHREENSTLKIDSGKNKKIKTDSGRIMVFMTIIIQTFLLDCTLLYWTL